MQPQPDTEKIKNKLAQIRKIMLTGTDPVILSKYRRLFKKEFSIFRRSWAAAWLLMHFDQNGGADIKPVLHEKKNDEQNNSLSEDESKRLFISVGRNRHLYPKEILSLIGSKASVSSEDIGVIRILDNYSFVQVRENQAQRIIDALNGQQFRGRTLTVNFAKPKNGDTAENTDSE